MKLKANLSLPLWRRYPHRHCFPLKPALFATFILFYVSYILFVNSIGRYTLTTHVLEELYDPVAPNTAQPSPKILLVSAFFPLATSKHSLEDYKTWLGEFLGQVTTDLYFFTSPEMAPLIMQLRSAHSSLPIILDTSYTSPFDIPPLHGRESAYDKMHTLDREAHIHTPELYAVWNAKPFLLAQGVEFMKAKAGKTYDYAFWNDAGSFRGHHGYRKWPDPARVERVWRMGEEKTGTRKDDLLFYPLTGIYDEKNRDWREEDGPVDHDISEGSFFGGSPSTVKWWSQTFYHYHDYYLSLGLFVGKDQTIFNAIFLLFPERIITNYYYQAPIAARQGRGSFPLKHLETDYLGACGSQWFYYQFWLSDKETRDTMRTMWVENWRWDGLLLKCKNTLGVKRWAWWRRREACRMTDVLALEDVLKERFGEGWKSPARSLEI